MGLLRGFEVASSRFSFKAGLVLVLVLGVSLLVPRTAEAATFTVDSTTDAVDGNPGDGFCASAALPSEGIRCTLRAAIMEANALGGADTVQLPAGLYLLTIPGADEDAGFTGDLDVRGDLTVTGVGAAQTVIDANRLDRVLHMARGVASEVRGVTIRNGRATDGGGIASDGFQLFLIDSVVENNVATSIFGGGIAGGGNLVLTRSVVRANEVTGTPRGTGQGGGIANLNVNLIDSIVADNVAGTESRGLGGGIQSGGTVRLTNSAISGNRAGGSNSNEGGGIWTGGLVATNSVISGNSALRGIAGGAKASTVTLLNTTVSGNSVSGDGSLTGLGGGLWVRDSLDTQLTNVTVIGNSAPIGSGLFVQRVGPYVGGSPTQIRISNGLVAGNTGSAGCSEPLTSLGHNLDGGDSCGFHASGDLTNTDPKVAPLALNGGPTMTHALQPGSPAIDAGDNADCPATDQRGAARPRDGNGDGAAICDVGSFEAPAMGDPLPVVCSPRPPIAVRASATGDGRLRGTITSSGTTNTLTTLRLTRLDNAQVEVAGQAVPTGGITVSLPPGTTATDIVLRRVTAGRPAMVHFVIVDRCGEWPTFVGGGPSAF